MTYVETETAIRSEVVSTALMHLNEGDIQNAIACFTDWADYYDGLTSRRTAVAAHFTEWLEL